MADNNVEIICPACQAKMVKLQAPNQNFSVDVCLEGCGGIFFDNQEMKKFDEESENIDFIIEALKGREFSKVDETKQRICPYCFAPMQKVFSDSSLEVEVDSCYTCGANFLDCGELTKIREQHETEQERKDDFNKKFLETFANDIAKNEIEAHKLAQSRSFARKLFLSFWEK